MYALFLVLNDITKLDNIMEIFYTTKVGATTFDSVGMGKFLLENQLKVPFFSSIRKIINEQDAFNKTIISVIRTEDKLKEATSKIKRELNNFEELGVGFMFVVPVIECYGLNADTLLEE
ncbi:hypothetical protein GOQ29_04525 [Clostridium sp. D2Q-14]|uniref:hypothetical protein n=1 Tax=Anaeromonas gelatinilytica TaxID=2683194 RepID=UPI00193C8696|nr:hypothetical protein [Anaeromonas gelatinilytica]MBS4534879.1 hypothetical protein [Anaeromonas gelatinilytica]